MSVSALLSWRMLRRNGHAGELHLLFAALVIAVASVTSVGFFTDRISQALHRQANELLGADLLLVSNRPLSQEFARHAARLGLQHATTVTFLSMVLSGDKSQLAEIKAVSEGYPLRGQLRVAQGSFVAGEVTRLIPAPGTVWPDGQLLTQLGLQMGATLALGEAELSVAKIVVQEPDRSGDFFSIAPRVLMHLHDLPKTRLIQVGSRVKYRLQVAGAAPAVQAFRAYAEPRLNLGERIEGIEDARPEVRAALQRAQQFLGLAALISVVLASVAVASAARRFTQRHLDDCAIMRCLGATQGLITRIYLYQMLWLGLVASLVGCMLGYLAQLVLADVLGSLVAANLPAPSALPVVFGVLVGLITLLGFAAPPLLALREVPMLRVLRRELAITRGHSLGTYTFGLILLAALMIWQAGDIKLGSYLVLGTLATLATLAGVALALVQVIKLTRARGGVAWRFGLANIARRARSSVVQIVALGLGIMALLLLTLVRSDLLTSWQGSLPRDAPNRFIINIQPDQVAQLERFFAAQGMPHTVLYPMVRGRLTHINDKAVSPQDYQQDDRAARLVEREFNLSWAAQLPEGNQLIAGPWWDSADYGKPLLSVEQGIAQTLGIKLGDTLTYRIAGTPVTAKVVNLREVDWDSFRVNFFVIAAPRVLDNFPASYITSLYLPEHRAQVLSRLVQGFPNLTVIDVAAIMTQVRHIIERVTLAVEYVFLFTVLAGLLVLYAAIQSTQDERRQESAVLRTLGASRRQILQGLIAEFAILGLLAGLVAAIAASLLAYVLAQQVLHLPYSFDPWLWLTGIVLGVLGVGLVSGIATRSILRQPPVQSLREI